MIKKLRARFIRTAMLAVILVLLLMMGIINILNYRNVAKEADTILAMLSDHDTPLWSNTPPKEDPGALLPPNQETPPAENSEGGDEEWARELAEWNDTYGRRGLMRGSLSKETPFESRYFIIRLDTEGTVLSLDASHITSMDQDDLEDYVAAATRAHGFYDHFRYLKNTDDAVTTLLFLDCSRSLNNFRSFLLLSVLVSALALVGVFLLVVLLSKRIIRPVQESYEKQRRFITDAGHELKTPLTIIDADISVAEMENGGNEWLDDVKVQTKRLSDLTNDLIYLSRMDEGSAQLQYIDFPLSDLVHDTAQSFRARMQIEERDFHVEIEPLLTCQGDEKSIEKLLTILLDNAVKYTKKNGQILLSLQKKSKVLSLVVENETDAVNAENLEHLFDRFYRADASRNSAKGGYGIGLSIAQAIVLAHKGTIEASAPASDRLRFTVHLPF